MIKLKNINMSYTSGFFKKNKQKILKNIDMNIETGGIYALLGNSGSGKSTIAKLICGMEKYNSGLIFLNGEKFEAKEYREEINIIFQHPESSFDPRLSMYDNLKEILEIRNLYSKKEWDKVIKDNIALLGLEENLLRRRVSEISGGEAQRFAIARALLTKSKFLILDEVTSMLDISTQAQILELLKFLQKEKNLTYLFISHDLEVVKNFCDYIIVLDKGEIIEQGKVKEVLSNPKTEYLKTILKVFNKLNI